MRIFRWDYVISTLVLFAVMLVTPLVFSFDMFKPLRNSLSDFKITDIVDSKIVPRENIFADTNIVIINTEINTDGFNKQISNGGFAQLIVLLNEYNPKVIGIKTILKESGNDRHDFALANVLNHFDNIVLSFKFSHYNKKGEFDSIISSSSIFTENTKLGYDNFLKVDEEKYHTIRKFMPVMKNHKKDYKSFSQKVVEIYNPEIGKKNLKRNNKLENINYLGHYHFFRMEATDVFEKNFNPEIIENKIVLLGRISTSNSIDSHMVIKDVFFSPLNESYTGKAFPDMYGTILHANIISMILNNNYIDSMPLWLVYIITAILVYFNMVIFTYIIVRNKKWYEIISLFVFVIESLSLLLITAVVFVFFRYEMDLTMAIFALAASVFTFEIYNNSLKPLTIKMYYKFLHKG